MVYVIFRINCVFCFRQSIVVRNKTAVTTILGVYTQYLFQKSLKGLGYYVIRLLKKTETNILFQGWKSKR